MLPGDLEGDRTMHRNGSLVGEADQFIFIHLLEKRVRFWVFLVLKEFGTPPESSESLTIRCLGAIPAEVWGGLFVFSPAPGHEVRTVETGEGMPDLGIGGFAGGDR